MKTESVLTDEQIASILNSEADMPEHRTMLDYARAIEQAVLQSEQVQAWKKDAQRLSFIESECGADIVRLSGDEWEVSGIDEMYGVGHTLRDAIDAAMEKQ